MMLRSFVMCCCSGAVLAALASCSTMKKAVDAIPMPHMPKMKMPKVSKLIPGMGSSDSTGSDDPVVPFDASHSLGYGHTIRLEVYDGARSFKKLWSGLVMVSQEGVIEFENIGSARVGGRSLPDAVRMIESVFRTAGKVASQAHVHLISVENTPLVTVDGDVKSLTVLPMWKNITVADAVLHSGGRRAGSTARSVYVTQGDKRRFFTSLEAASANVTLRAGDIITLSPTL